MRRGDDGWARARNDPRGMRGQDTLEPHTTTVMGRRRRKRAGSRGDRLGSGCAGGRAATRGGLRMLCGGGAGGAGGVAPAQGSTVHLPFGTSRGWKVAAQRTICHQISAAARSQRPLFRASTSSVKYAHHPPLLKPASCPPPSAAAAATTRGVVAMDGGGGRDNGSGPSRCERKRGTVAGDASAQCRIARCRKIKLKILNVFICRFPSLFSVIIGG